MLSKKAGIKIFIFDVLALAGALIFSGILAKTISVHFLNNNYISFFSFGTMIRVTSFAALSALVLVAFYNRGHYTRRVPWWNQVRFILIVVMFALCIEGFMFFAMKYNFSRLWITLSWVTCFFFLLIARHLARYFAIKGKCWMIPTYVIGNGRNLIETLYAVYSEGYTGYDIKNIIINSEEYKLSQEEIPLTYKNIPQKRIINIEKFVINSKKYFYIIAYDSFSDGLDVESLIKTMEKNNISYAIVPPLKGIPLYGATPQYFFGYDIIFISPRYKIDSPFGRLLKRMMDIFGSIFISLLLSPLALLLIFMIKSDGGAAFYSQVRIGKNGKKFKCWKFRSMVVNAEKVLQDILKNDKKAKRIWEVRRKLANDPRVTKVGNFLRKTSLDEIPQLYNVLKGEMSIVGPRPILPDETHFFDENQMKDYHSVKPGVTGLWQVSGRNDTTFKFRAHLDSWYVRNWSFWYDIVICFKTAVVLLKRTGVY